MKSILSNLSQYKIVLGSNSPRRRELLAGLDIDGLNQEKGGSLHMPADNPDFRDRRKEVPSRHLFPKHCGRTRYRSISPEKRRKPTFPSMSADGVLITADTIVWTFGEILGKPKDREDAITMLRKLSGRVHEVITGVCITTKEKTVSFSLHRLFVLPIWTTTRSSTMSISTARLIKPAAMAYRSGSVMWQSKLSMVVFIM